MSVDRHSRILSFALGVFRRLTRIMPRRYQRHRAEAIDLMAQLAEAAYRERGSLGVVAVTASSVGDLIAAVPSHYVRVFGGALRRDVFHAIRSLPRRPLSGAAEIATLAIGIGLNAAVFSVVDWVLLRPLAYPAPHELVSVSAVGSTSPAGAGAVSYSDFQALSRATSLRASAAFSSATRVIAGQGFDPAHVGLGRVAGELFT